VRPNTEKHPRPQPTITDLSQSSYRHCSHDGNHHLRRTRELRSGELLADDRKNLSTTRF